MSENQNNSSWPVNALPESSTYPYSSDGYNDSNFLQLVKACLQAVEEDSGQSGSVALGRSQNTRDMPPPQQQPGSGAPFRTSLDGNHFQFQTENVMNVRSGTHDLPQNVWEGSPLVNFCFNGNHSQLPAESHLSFHSRTHDVPQGQLGSIASANTSNNGNPVGYQPESNMSFGLNTRGMHHGQLGNVASANLSRDGYPSGYGDESEMSSRPVTRNQLQQGWGNIPSINTSNHVDRTGYRPEGHLTFPTVTRNPLEVEGGSGAPTTARLDRHDSNLFQFVLPDDPSADTREVAEYQEESHIPPDDPYDHDHDRSEAVLQPRHSEDRHHLIQQAEETGLPVDNAVVIMDWHHRFVLGGATTTIGSLYRDHTPQNTNPLPEPTITHHTPEYHNVAGHLANTTIGRDPGSLQAVHDEASRLRTDAAAQSQDVTSSPVNPSPERDDSVYSNINTNIVAGSQSSVHSTAHFTPQTTDTNGGFTTRRWDGNQHSACSTPADYNGTHYGPYDGSGSSSSGTETTHTALINNGSPIRSQSNSEGARYVNPALLSNRLAEPSPAERPASENTQGEDPSSAQLSQNAASVESGIRSVVVPASTRISVFPSRDMDVHGGTDTERITDVNLTLLDYCFTGAVGILQKASVSSYVAYLDSYRLEFFPRAGTDEVVIANKGGSPIHVAQILRSNEIGPLKMLVHQARVHLDVGFWRVWRDPDANNNANPGHLTIQIHPRPFKVSCTPSGGAGSKRRHHGGGDASAKRHHARPGDAGGEGSAGGDPPTGGTGTSWGEGVPQSEVDDALVMVRPGETLHISSAPSQSELEPESYTLACTRRICSQVIEGWHDGYKTLVAAKVVRDPTRARVRTLSREWEGEATALSVLTHRAIAEMVGVDARLMAIYLRPYLCRNLGELRDQKGMFGGTRSDAGYVLTDMGSALAYVHSQGFTHFDVKPGNILYDTANRKAILIDFGLAAREMRPDLRGSGTPWYAPPEYRDDYRRGPESDMYALGVVMLYLSGRVALPDVTVGWWGLSRVYDRTSYESKQMDDWIAAVQSIAERGKDVGELDELISGLLHEDPKERFTGEMIESRTGGGTELD